MTAISGAGGSDAPGPIRLKPPPQGAAIDSGPIEPSCNRDDTYHTRQMPHGLRPGEWDTVKRTPHGEMHAMDDDEREALVAELAKHSKFTVDELREMDDEFLEDLHTELDRRLEDGLDAQAAASDDDDLVAGGFFTNQDRGEGA